MPGNEVFPEQVLKYFPCRKPFNEPGGRTPESVNISGPTESSTIFPYTLKKANSMWKGPGMAVYIGWKLDDKISIT